MRKRRIVKILAGSGLAVLAAALLYAVYVFAAFYRLEDRLNLEITGEASLGAPRTEASYRAVSCNIGFGAYSADYSFFMDGGRESRARSAQAVRENVGGAGRSAAALGGDLYFFQEVDADGTRSCHVDERPLLKAEIGAGFLWTFAQNYDSPYLLWPLLEPHGANRSGLLTASAFPADSALRRSLPIEEGLMKLVDLDRCYIKERIPVADGGELVVYNIHLSAYTSDGSIAEEQMELLFSDMRAEYAAGNFVIAGGDFNKDLLGDSPEIFGVSGEEYTWAQPIPEDLIPRGLRLAAPLDETRPVPSCRNADRPYGPESFVLTVDGFVVSDNVEVLGCGVLDTGFAYSDHNPVFLDFRLTPPTER